MSSKKQVKQQSEMSFLDHLEVLRWHLIRATAAILIFTILAFFYKSFIFDTVIFGPKDPQFVSYLALCWISQQLGGTIFCFTEMPFELLNMRMAGQFTMHLWVSFVAGFVVAFPYIIFELWRFISPGLHPSERKHSRGAIFIISLLFIVGILFGYYVIVPFSVQFLATYTVSADVVNRIDLSSYISTVTSVTLASGLVFELPVIIYFLSKMGIVTPELMRTYRRHAIVVILILSAVITPPDVTSQILVTIPVLILYELSIKVSARVQKNKLKQSRLI